MFKRFSFVGIKFTSGMSNGEPLNYIVKFSVNKLE